MSEHESRPRSSRKTPPTVPAVELTYDEAGVTIMVARRVLWVSHDEARELLAALERNYPR